jgi:hypothetical protein
MNSTSNDKNFICKLFCCWTAAPNTTCSPIKLQFARRMNSEVEIRAGGKRWKGVLLTPRVVLTGARATHKYQFHSHQIFLSRCCSARQRHCLLWRAAFIKNQKGKFPFCSIWLFTYVSENYVFVDADQNNLSTALKKTDNVHCEFRQIGVRKVSAGMRRPLQMFRGVAWCTAKAEKKYIKLRHFQVRLNLKGIKSP